MAIETMSQLLHKFLLCKFVVALLATFAVAAFQEQDSQKIPDLKEWSVDIAEEKEAICPYLKTLEDDKLREIFNALLALPDFRSTAGYELCLSEIARRGGMKWEVFLNEKYELLISSQVKPYEDADELESGSKFNLELLTVLRRLQGQSDPLQIYIDDSEELTVKGMALPQLKVKIKNVDVEKAGVGFTLGGNYRRGRQSRWRVLVEDEKGKAVTSRRLDSLMGGGIFQEGILEHGESWETTLNVRRFIEVPPPGKYKLTIYYHNTRTIDTTGVEKLVVSRSKTVPFIVLPLSIALSKEDRSTVKKLVAELDGKKKLKIVAGTYGKWAHEFVSPESPEGKLLGSGLKAVPSLIESLEDKALSSEKKAWLLGILFSLTGEIDPRISLGEHDCWRGGWQVWGGRDGASQSGGISFTSKTSVLGGSIDDEELEEFVNQWKDWLKNVDVTEAKSDR